MDHDKKELTLNESIAHVMKTLPPIIQTYLTKGGYTLVARSLMAKYNLRIDQGGVLEREIMLLLMGVENPDEFTEALAGEARLDEQTVSNIIKDVNNQIFAPLRKEEEKGGMNENVQSPAKPVAPVAAPRPGVVTPPHIAPLPPKTVMPTRTAETLGDVVRSVLHTSNPTGNINLLEDHEEPHIDLNKAPAAPVAQVVPPSPGNLPGAMPSYSIPTEIKPEPKIQPIIQKPVFRTPIEPKPVSLAPAPAPITSYPSDPYREPIDEPIDET